MLEKKPVLAISITTGWAVRNFFQTGIIANLQNSFQILVFTTPNFRNELVRYGYGTNIKFIVREDRAEPLSWRVFRQIKKKLYMESRKSNTEAIWEKYVKRPLYQKVGGLILTKLLLIFNASRLLTMVEDLDFALNNCTDLDMIFQNHKPVLFFATHASTYFEESLLHSSVRNGVPVIFMVLSWDHLSSKVVLSRKYDTVLVWNNITKTEILETCDAYRDDQIIIVGVPQYDCYREKPSITYQQWCHKYNLDPSRKTILFSTMPQVRHEQQHIILERLLEKINAARELPDNLQVLIKCHPFDNTNKYDHLLERDYPVAICRSTLPLGAPQIDWFPSQEEMFVSRDALYFCTININIFSTVTLEAAYYNKPIIHIAYDPCPVTNRIPCREYYNFEHFKSITDSGASTLVEDDSALYSAVLRYLEDPDYRKQQRRALVETYFVLQNITAVESIVEFIKLKAQTSLAAKQLPCHGEEHDPISR